MDKPRTIHYAGQQIIVGKTTEHVKMLPVDPHLQFVKIVAGIAIVAAVLLVAIVARSATPVYAPAGGVAITPVFSSSQALTGAAVGVVLSSRTTTANKTFYLQHLDVEAFLVVPSSFTVEKLGGVTVQSPTGTVIATMTFVNSSGAPMSKWVLDLAEPAPFASGVTLSVVGAAQTTSSVSWVSNLIGYEK